MNKKYVYHTPRGGNITLSEQRDGRWTLVTYTKQCDYVSAPTYLHMDAIIGLRSILNVVIDDSTDS
jgi:hypothetical protein